MGDKIADQIRDRAAARGTAMHTYLEHYLGWHRLQGPDTYWADKLRLWRTRL